MTVERTEFASISDVTQYRLELNQFPRVRLTLIEEEALKERLIEGDETAREVVITSNLRLVMKIAMGIKRKIDFADIVQAGNLGLVEASGKYEYVDTGNFQYYAAIAIRNKIFEHLYEHNLINIPLELRKLIKLFLKTESTLLQELFREPTIEEFAEKLNLRLDQIIDVTQAIYRSNVLSLNVDIFDDGNEEYIDRIRDRKQTDLPDQIIQRDFQKIYSLENELRKKKLLKGLAILPPRQRQILIMQYGLFDDVSRNFEDIAKELSLTPQSIGETAKKAINDLNTQTPENAIFTVIVESKDEQEVRKVLIGNITNIHLRNVLSNLFNNSDFKEIVFKNQLSLTDREREVVKLYHEDHLMFREIGVRFGGLHDATIRENYQSALNKLREAIINYLTLN